MLSFVLLSLAAAVSAASIRVRADTCDVHGYDRSNAYSYDGSGTYATRSACGARCSADVNCKSFGFGGAECLLYDKTVAENVNVDTASPYSFSDVGCLTTPTTTSSAAPSPTPSQLCDGIGYDLGNPAYNYDGSGAAASLAACSSRCLSQHFCLGFAFSSTECLLYTVAASSNFYPQASSPYHFYDRTCFPEPATTTSSTSSATPTPSQIFCLQVTGTGPPGKGYYAYFHEGNPSDGAIYFTSSTATTAPPGLFYIYAPYGTAFLWDTRGNRVEFGYRLSIPDPPEEQPLNMVGPLPRGDQADSQFVYPSIDTSNQLQGAAGANFYLWNRWAVNDASFATEQRLYLETASGVKSQIGLTVVPQSLCPAVAVANP